MDPYSFDMIGRALAIGFGYFLLLTLHLLFVRWLFRISEIVSLLHEIKGQLSPREKDPTTLIPAEVEPVHRRKVDW
jgi:hypothetical protein